MTRFDRPGQWHGHLQSLRKYHAGNLRRTHEAQGEHVQEEPAQEYVPSRVKVGAGLLLATAVGWTREGWPNTARLLLEVRLPIICTIN